MILDTMQSSGFAWWDSKKKRFIHFYSQRSQVEMCSPDGFERKTKDGDGEIVPVVIIDESAFKELTSEEKRKS